MFGLAGYWRFGGTLTGNVLINYDWINKDDKPDTLVTISWLGVAFSTMASYPLGRRLHYMLRMFFGFFENIFHNDVFVSLG